MYLKKLEMIGFKSFAEKTVLEFHPGVTAIVGPNGCGKSNVLDAIRWVLGEQSAKALRGSEMADVIFNGTDSRKQIGMAEVAMTFVDCEKELGTEYNEVTLCRRVFRDGVGEYELNKTGCRLRDIHHLIMDTGIGRSAYSIMEQGRIDKLLSAKPEDRREVFEEAAGITKYKSQKKEAQRKLEQTEANLIRLEDIVREVKRQIGSLQRQAGKARRYKEFYDQLRSMEIGLSSHQIRQLIDQIENEEKKSKNLFNELLVIEQQQDQQEISLKEQRHRADELEKETDTTRLMFAETKSALERAQGRIGFNEERLIDLQQTEANARLEIAASEERYRVQTEQMALLEEQIQSGQMQLQERQVELEQLNQSLRQANEKMTLCREKNTEKESLFQGVEIELQDIHHALAGRDSEKKTYALRIEAAESDRKSFQEQLIELENQKNQVSQKLDLNQTNRSKIQSELEVFQEKFCRLQQELNKIKNERDAMERRQLEFTSQRELLERLETTHEGFSSSAQKIIEARTSPELVSLNIHDTLADLIEVHPGNERAIHALLGARLEALVLENVEAARKIFTYLSQHNQANHLLYLAPIDIPRIAWSSPNRSELALNFVTALNDGQRILQALLGESYIVDDFDAAMSLKMELPHATVATRCGHLITGEGIICFGEAQTDGGLGRKQEILRLAEAIENIQGDIGLALQNEDQIQQVLQDDEALIARQRDQLREIEETYRTVDRENHILGKQIEETKRKIETIQSEIRRLNEADLHADEHYSEQLIKRDTLQTQKKEIVTEIESQNQLLPQLLEEESRLNHLGTEARIKVAALEEKLNGFLTQKEPISIRLRELKETIQARTDELVNCEQKRKQYQTENETLRQETIGLETQINEIETRLQVLKVQREELHLALEQAEQKLRGYRKHHAELQQIRSNCELALARYKLDMNNLKERMLRSYQVDIEQCVRSEMNPEIPSETSPSSDQVEVEIQEMNWEEIESQVIELRAKLDAMGPVNLEAITEYDELESRYQFLISQQTDLLNSKKDLEEAISRINRMTRKLFVETFEQVRINFQSTFTELFGGGKTNLLLVNPDDPLESGIDIIAKPPGKQPLSVSLLSGGERTMTAVALLFAIYMVKPSPFCILDEMDAALDESNINRFVNMLQRFLYQSQFLLITHNKKTISIADALYGITMEESGVSKVVSVKFSKENNDRNGHVKENAIVYTKNKQMNEEKLSENLPI